MHFFKLLTFLEKECIIYNEVVTTIRNIGIVAFTFIVACACVACAQNSSPEGGEHGKMVILPVPMEDIEDTLPMAGQHIGNKEVLIPTSLEDKGETNGGEERVVVSKKTDNNRTARVIFDNSDAVQLSGSPSLWKWLSPIF